jgi:glycosyltransferase involved in cell wall biosynthesis
LPLADRADFFAAIDIFSKPSRTDTVGIVILDAGANALPVVAAAAGGVAEVVTHDQNGLLVPFGDLDQLSNAIQNLLNDPSLAHRLGDAGQRLVNGHGYTWDDRFAALRDRIDPLIRPRVFRPFDLAAAG